MLLRNLSALGCGLLFSAGLIVAQMVNPQKILAFLDVAGSWDPSLALVMAGALLTLGLLQYWIFKRAAPLFEQNFQCSDNKTIDLSLIIGAAVFGLGWGIVGFCPGPAIVAIMFQPLEALSFVVAMAVGMRMGEFKF